MNLRKLPPLLAQQWLKYYLTYEPETGVFRWNIRNGAYIRPGRAAGTWDIGKDRFYIQIEGVKYLAHRLAWLYMTGDWPVYEIEHDDQNSQNNRWINLKDMTHSENVTKAWANRKK